MAISPYFHHQTFNTEQQLMKDLTRETIYLRGNDYMYIPRNKVNLDLLFGEDVQSAFDKPIIVEMYCKSNPSWDGADIMSKFGMIDERLMSFEVSCERFREEAKRQGYDDITEPREGDLIYHDLTKTLLEVTYINPYYTPFYQTGVAVTWTIDCKRYIHNHDTFNVDADPWKHPTESSDQFLPTQEDMEHINNIIHETDRAVIQKESDDITNFDENDPFTESKERGSHY